MTRFEKLFTSREKLVKTVLYLWDKVEKISSDNTLPENEEPVEEVPIEEGGE